MQVPTREALISAVHSELSGAFDTVAEQVFTYQRSQNPLFQRYLSLLGEKPILPCLPISFFKSQVIQTGAWHPAIYFESSGTGGGGSKHWVRDEHFYLENAKRGFTHFYGNPADWCFLALLPNYLQRGHSSLVAMVRHFIQRSKAPESGFFLNNLAQLRDTLHKVQEKNQKTILIGVSYALLDLAEQYPCDLSGVLIMETGGMKGRRKEMTRAELHAVLRQQLNPKDIHSEYGMTELFSQAYALGGSTFMPAPTMRVFATEINDPFCLAAPGKTGVLNIIDLANIDTISFIQTEDVGRVYSDGSFDMMGRLDTAELRGCNLMVE